MKNGLLMIHSDEVTPQILTALLMELPIRNLELL